MRITLPCMKTVTLKLPDRLAAEIQAEASKRGISRSDVMRERLQRGADANAQTDPLADIADVIGSVEGLPSDLSERVDHYLKVTGFGRDRSR